MMIGNVISVQTILGVVKVGVEGLGWEVLC